MNDKSPHSVAADALQHRQLFNRVIPEIRASENFMGSHYSWPVCIAPGLSAHRLRRYCRPNLAVSHSRSGVTTINRATKQDDIEPPQRRIGQHHLQGLVAITDLIGRSDGTRVFRI